MRDALIACFELPNDPELAADLEGPRYEYDPQQHLALESKDQMRARGLASPDLGEALAMCFDIMIRKRDKPPVDPLMERLGPHCLNLTKKHECGLVSLPVQVMIL